MQKFPANAVLHPIWLSLFLVAMLVSHPVLAKNGSHRTEEILVLDFDLRLKGMSIVKNALFTEQKLRLSSVQLPLAAGT